MSSDKELAWNELKEKFPLNKSVMLTVVGTTDVGLILDIGCGWKDEKILIGFVDKELGGLPRNECDWPLVGDTVEFVVDKYVENKWSIEFYLGSQKSEYMGLRKDERVLFLLLKVGVFIGFLIGVVVGVFFDNLEIGSIMGGLLGAVVVVIYHYFKNIQM